MRPAPNEPTAPPTVTIKFTKPIILPSAIKPNKLDGNNVNNISKLLKAKPKIIANRKSVHISSPVINNQSIDPTRKPVRMVAVFLTPILSAINPSGSIVAIDIPPIIDITVEAIVGEIPISIIEGTIWTTIVIIAKAIQKKYVDTNQNCTV
jgi:hypothetical protein